MTGLVQNAIDALALGSLYALTALGIGLIFGVMRLINFAHGDLIMIGGYALIVPSSAAAAVAFIGAWPAPAMVAAIGLHRYAVRLGVRNAWPFGRSVAPTPRCC